MKKNYKRNWLFKLKSLAVFGSLLFAGSASAQLSGTYTIDAGGSGDFTSFTELSDTLISDGVSGPVVINVTASSGPYSEEFYLDELTGASSTNTITINGNGEKITNNNVVIELEGTDFITFNNLVIESTSTNAGQKVTWAYDDVESITFDGCEVIATASATYSGYPNYYNSAYMWFGTGNFSYQDGTSDVYDITVNNCHLWNGSNTLSSIGRNQGIVVKNPSGNDDDQNITITNNEVEDFGWYGIYSRRTSGFVCNNNEVHNTNQTNNTYSYGIYAYAYFMDGEPVEINDNYVHDLVVNKTYIYASGYGIYYYAYYGDNNFNINNNIVDLKGPYYLYGVYAYARFSTATEANVLGNTITFSGTNSVSFARHYAIYNYYWPSSGDCSNNIVYDESVYNGTGGVWGIYTYNPAGLMDHNNIDVSDVTGTGASTRVHTAYNTGTNYTTLSDWQGNYGGANTIAENPQFTDKANGNYTPQSIAMANKGAVKTANPNDYSGATRNATSPDMGALEYFVDVEVVSVDMTTAPQCAPYTEAVAITIKNNGASAISNVPLQYDLNGGTPVSEVMTASVAAGATATFTFAVEPNFYGTNAHVVTASVVGDDDNPANSSANTTINTTVSPTGGDFAMGAQFDGYFNDGTLANPDVTVKNEISEYSISQPTAYAPNAPTAATYTYGVTATTIGAGTDVTSDIVQGFTPTSEVVTLDPAWSLAGETLLIELTVTDAVTGCDTSFSRHMLVPHTPVASFDASDICLGDVAQFKNTSTLGGTDYIVTKWEFDDPDPLVMDDNSDIKDGFWEYTTYGNGVVVEMTVANGVYPKFEYSASQTINVTPKPEIDFKVLNACEGSPITIVDSTSTPTGSSIDYSWDFGGEYTATGSNPSYTFTTPGQRQITLSASSNGCDAELTKNAYQFEMPAADFTSVGSCNFVDVEFTSTSTIANGAGMGFSWDFGDGDISREENPSKAFANAGAQNITLTTTSEFGCANSVSKSITLNESPEADFTWDAACNLTEINFTRTGSVPNGGANSTYTWDMDGTPYGMENPSHLFSKVGPRPVTLTIDDLNGCSNSITKEVDVVLQAVAGFTANGFNAIDVCEGDMAVFTNSSTVASGDLAWGWNFGDGNTSTDHSPTHVYTTPGEYNVTLNAIVDGGCPDEVTVQVLVNPAPDATFTVKREGRTIYLDGPEGNDVYRWTFGNGGKDIVANPEYTYNNVDQGTYTVCLATKKGVCSSDDCQDVTINLAGIEELTQNNDMINVYPNPTQGKFNIEVENAGDVVVKVGDILGNVLDVNITDNLNGTYSVDMSAIADGVYFVQVKNGDFFATKRITVSK